MANEKPQPKIGKKKKVSLSKLKHELDAVFSKYIRYRDKGKCFTCGYSNHPKKMQNGHFNPRQHLSTRYDERNCNWQCMSCNMFYGGNPATYAVRLEQKYGKGIVQELEGGRWRIVKLDPFWYYEQIKIYEEKLKEVIYE